MLLNKLLKLNSWTVCKLTYLEPNVSKPALYFHEFFLRLLFTNLIFLISRVFLFIYSNIIYPFFAVDEGSAVPDKNLAQIRIISEEALKKAHEMKIIKSADEAAQEEDVDDDEEIKFNRRVEKLGTK